MVAAAAILAAPPTSVNGAPGGPGARVPRTLAAQCAGQRVDIEAQPMLVENDEHTPQHNKNLMQHNNTTTEQTTSEQASARSHVPLTQRERQATRQATRTRI